MMHLVFVTGILLELNMVNRRQGIRARDWQKVRYATRRVSKTLAEVTHWQIIKTYWNTAMQQNTIWSIAFEVDTKEILTEVCRIND
jgi:hypothetical protein